jgi:hypothetical protein
MCVPSSLVKEGVGFFGSQQERSALDPKVES